MFSETEISKARNADFCKAIVKKQPEYWKKEGTNEYRYLLNHSITVKEGMTVARDWSTKEVFNPINFLIKQNGYNFTDAVETILSNKEAISLASQQKQQKKVDIKKKDFVLPSKNDRCSRVYGYLVNTRKIPYEKVTQLVKAGLLYEDTAHNCVFVSKNKDFYEARGTATYSSRQFHQTKNLSPEKSWAFATKPGDVVPGKTTVYICESAIDAVSLNVLKEESALNENALYVGIAGVANTQRIDYFLNKGYEVVLAVDNDPAGKNLCDQYPDLKRLSPINKDWNEDLVQKTMKPVPVSALDEGFEDCEDNPWHKEGNTVKNRFHVVSLVGGECR